MAAWWHDHISVGKDMETVAIGSSAYAADENGIFNAAKTHIDEPAMSGNYR